MVSKTAKTTAIRARKQHKMGRQRKNALVNLGSTPTQKDLFGSELPAEKVNNKA